MTPSPALQCAGASASRSLAEVLCSSCLTPAVSADIGASCCQHLEQVEAFDSTSELRSGHRASSVLLREVGGGCASNPRPTHYEGNG
jgi:hypothetical protein